MQKLKRRAPALRRPTVVLAASIAFLASACGGASETGEAPEETSAMMAGGAKVYTIPGEEVVPEGVAYSGETDDLIVGSTTDGTVYRGNVGGGSTETEVFLEPGQDGRSTAIGMKVDQENQLYIAGGDTGMAWVYYARSGDLVRAYETPETEMTFINDVAIATDGDAYFTDSMRPTLFRIPAGSTEPEMEPWLDFDGTPVEYTDGFNLNGIAATEDGRYLITVQSGTGQLFRIDTESREVVEIDLGGDTVTNGDGILLEGQTLYVVRNQQGRVVPVEMDESFATREVGEGFSDPSFRYPTTIAGYGDNPESSTRLLVVNAQFDERGGDPEIPFTVSDIEIP